MESCTKSQLFHGVILATRQPAELRLGGGAHKELHTCFLAMVAKVALAVAGLFFGIGQRPWTRFRLR
jgi:hypothetical protein